MNLDDPLTSARSSTNAHSGRGCRERRAPGDVSSRWTSFSRTLFEQRFFTKWEKRLAFDVDSNIRKHGNDAGRHNTLGRLLMPPEGRGSSGTPDHHKPLDLTTNISRTSEVYEYVFERPRPAFLMAGAQANVSTGALSTAASSAVLPPAFMPKIVHKDLELDSSVGYETASTSPAYSVEADEMIDCEVDKDESKFAGLRKGWYKMQTLCARNLAGSSSRRRARSQL